MTDMQPTQTVPSQTMINALEARNASLVNQLGIARTNHQEDIDRIGRALLAKAEERSWCDEYDEFVDSLNDDLTRPLVTRQRDFTVELTYTVVIRQDICSTTFDKAVEQAREDIEGQLDNFADVHTYDLEDSCDRT